MRLDNIDYDKNLSWKKENYHELPHNYDPKRYEMSYGWYLKVLFVFVASTYIGFQYAKTKSAVSNEGKHIVDMEAEE